MKDVVYILGTGSTWANNEIKYSLRSLARHLYIARHVYIVGELPRWGITEVRHIAFPDPHRNRERNIMEKIMQACLDERISDDFLFMNDDHFFLQNYQTNAFPFYHQGDIWPHYEKKNPNQRYARAMYNTFTLLKEHNLTTRHYDVHYPIMINKAQFIQVYKRWQNEWDWERFSDGFIVKSLYCNTVGVSGKQITDCKMNRYMGQEEIDNFLKEKSMFSIADIALNDALFNTFNKLYPNKSKYEF